MNRRLTPAVIALVAVLIAVTTVLTLVIRLPIGRGYLNPSDIVVTFAALAFGPWIGFAAGGIGTALADLLGGYAPFAPLSLLAHGIEGLLIGLIGWPRRSPNRMVLAWAAGGLAMVLIYLVGEGLFLIEWPAAFAEVPFNILQAIVGAVAGIPLVVAVRRAYPQVDRIGQRRDWTE
jgi:uncharacterized membrane protein